MLRVYERNTIASPEFKTLTTNGVAFDYTEADEKVVFIVNAASSGTITVVKGNGLQGVADITLNVPEGISVFTLDSMLFKNDSGTNKNKVVIKGTAKVAVVALP